MVGHERRVESRRLQRGVPRVRVRGRRLGLSGGRVRRLEGGGGARPARPLVVLCRGIGGRVVRGRNVAGEQGRRRELRILGQQPRATVRRRRRRWHAPKPRGRRAGHDGGARGETAAAAIPPAGGGGGPGRERGGSGSAGAAVVAGCGADRGAPEGHGAPSGPGDSASQQRRADGAARAAPGHAPRRCVAGWRGGQPGAHCGGVRDRPADSHRPPVLGTGGAEAVGLREAGGGGGGGVRGDYGVLLGAEEGVLRRLELGGLCLLERALDVRPPACARAHDAVA